MNINTMTNDLKSRVREYWNAHPCGTQFTEESWGEREFFADVDRLRYTLQPFMDELVEFRNFPGKELLEIGCGLGTDLFQFARGGAIVTGVDLTPRSVELAKRRFSLHGVPANFFVADAENLPFPDNSFDVVYSFGVLHHTPNTAKAIQEACRVLRPGGRIILMLYHRQSLHVWLGVPYHWLRSKLRGGSADDWIRVYDGKDNPLGKAYSRSSIRTMMSQFSDLSLRACDPIRRNVPGFVNTINQTLFARWFGFWMIAKGTKPVSFNRP